MNRWLIMFTGTLINIMLGVLYSWSIFVVPLSQKFGWSRAQLSWPFTMSIFTFALVMVAAGKWQDKVGPRIVCVTGGIIMGIGFILTSFVTSFPALVITFGVIGGAGVAWPPGARILNCLTIRLAIGCSYLPPPLPLPPGEGRGEG
ncbi:MAG: MFS transporter, partial [Nitrospinae bacterium]|nr:MFS transporter [Nitrospinota bacterium]